jgi:hypothetical protein
MCNKNNGEWKYTLSLGITSNLTYLGFDNQGNYLIAGEDEYIYTFDKNGINIKRDTAPEYFRGVNFLSNVNVPLSLKEEYIYSKSNDVIIILSNVKTRKIIQQIKIRPKKWVIQYRSQYHPQFRICNIDQHNNSYFIASGGKIIEKPTVERDEYVVYFMLEKYNENGDLLTQIPLIQRKGDKTRVWVTSTGDIYIMYYNNESNNGPFVSKWILKKEW